MEALSVREYRNNLAASFTKADNGEQVLIRRKNEIYALVKVGREDLMITPELQARIYQMQIQVNILLVKTLQIVRNTMLIM